MSDTKQKSYPLWQWFLLWPVWDDLFTCSCEAEHKAVAANIGQVGLEKVGHHPSLCPSQDCKEPHIWVGEL